MRKHDLSSFHKEAQKKKNFTPCAAGSKTIHQMISEMHDKQCDYYEHYERLICVVSRLKCVTRQGLVIRRNDEIEGNLNQLLLMRSEDYAPLSSWLSNSKYMSHDIVNEMIELMANYVQRNVLIAIKSRVFFSIICDETRDVSDI